jgi:2-succinyl-5-enolpyruvyl-6-hydroxy-3-cyclohexene-1-carboxylate synthase
LFVAPHGLDFAGLASAFGLDHRLVSELSGLDGALSDGMGGPSASILEIRTSAADDLAQERHYIDLLGHAGAS